MIRAVTAVMLVLAGLGPARAAVLQTAPAASDPATIPTVTIPLAQVMSSIVQARGDAAFVMDRDEDPKRLELTIDDASLFLTR